MVSSQASQVLSQIDQPKDLIWTRVGVESQRLVTLYRGFVSWPGEETARRLKLAIVAGLEFGRSWRVPRTSVADGVWSRSRKTRTPGRTSLAESRLKPPVCRRSSNCAAVAEARATLGRAFASAG